MKKMTIITLTVLLFILNGCTTMQPTTTTLKESTKIINIEGRNSQEIFEAIRFFISDKWKNPEKVTKYEDKNQNKISVSGELFHENVSAGFGSHWENIINGTLIFYIKDERFKVVASDIVSEKIGINTYGAITVHKTFPGVFIEQQDILDKYVNEIKQSILTEVDEMDF